MPASPSPDSAFDTASDREITPSIQSGGVNIQSEGDTRIDGDVVGRDKNVFIIQPAVVPPEPKAPHFLVPFPHNPDFVGRDTELAALHAMLKQGEGPVGIRPTVLVGLGGIGKTQLAVEYAHAHRADYPGGIFWLNAVNPLLLEFADLAEKLNLAARETPRDKAARKAWDYLDAHVDSLVIFDNVVEPADLNVPFSPDLVPANLRCRTLFTTRQRDFPRTFQPFEVKVLPEMGAMRLLLRARPEVLEEHHPEWGWARIVCATLGWLPLALELAAAYLGAYPEVTLTGYLERLRSEGRLQTVDDTELRPSDLPTRHEVAVAATLQTQWNRLADQDAQLLFRAAGQFPEASWIPVPRLALLTGIQSEARPGHPTRLSVALKKLYAVSLIEELTDDRLRLHPLVQTFSARLSVADFRLELAARVAALDEVARLQARVRRYGIDLVLEDVRTGLGFCMEAPENETFPRLSRLERALDRQAHHLKAWDAQAQPALFLQQLRNEALDLELDELKARTEAELAQLGQPYLCQRFKVSHKSPELVRVLQGHSDLVYGVALSADGQLAISASADNALIVWEVATGRELRTLKGHSSYLFGVALSTDGRLAVSASADNTLKVWDVATGREVRTLTGHSDAVYGVALSSDKRLALSVSEDQQIKVWDVATGCELRTLKGHKGSVHGVALSADGRLAASAAWDHTLNTWDVATGRKLHTLKGHRDTVHGVALSADGRLAVSASSDKTLKVWEVATGRELRTLKGHRDTVHGVALSADGRLAVSASSDSTLKVWEVATGRELCTLRGHNNTVESAAVSRDGRLGVSASVDKTLTVWNLSALLPGLGTPGTPTGVVIGDRQEAGADRARQAGNTRRMAGSGLSMRPGHNRWPNDITLSASGQLSADGKLAVSISNGDPTHNVLSVWDVVTGCELRTFKGHKAHINAVALSADGRLAVSASEDQLLKVWEVATGRRLHTLKGHGYGVEGVALSADGRLAVSASIDKTLKVWDVATGRALRTLVGHRGIVKGVALSADGRLAVSASEDQQIKVWEVETGRELRSLGGHNGPVHNIALSADGRLAVSAAGNNTLQVWEVETGRELRTLAGQSESVHAVALSADGRLAVSASVGGTIMVWKVATGQVIAIQLADTPFLDCNMTPDGKMIAAGDYIWMVHWVA